MKQFRKLLLLLIAILASYVSASACLCDTTPSVPKALKESSAVFAGRYTGSEFRKGIKSQFMEMRKSWETGPILEYEVLVHKFEVTTMWKGSFSREVILISDETRSSDGTGSVSDCGLGFEVGIDYLIYAYGTGDDFGTGFCTRTKRLKRAKQEIAQLNRLSPPKRAD